MMKNALNIFKIIVLAFFITTCCTSEYCTNVFHNNEIWLIGFTKEDMDTIVFKSYVANGNFETIIDSVLWTEPEAIAGTSVIKNNENIWVPIDLNPESDYIFDFLSIDTTYYLTNIKVTSAKCDDNSFCSEEYIMTTEYEINGITYYKPSIEIIK